MFGNNFVFILMVIASSLALASSADDGHCVWYDECYTDDFLRARNCPYNGTAQPLSMDGQQLLSRWCPNLMTNDGSVIKTCCSEKQLKTLDNNIKIVASVLQRCPSCLQNLVNHICLLTCSPNQSSFINVTSVLNAPDSNITYVDEIEVYITRRYLTGTYDSCSKVSVPSEGLLALDLMCGEWGASRCSAKKWFKYMGDARNNAYVPFQINYHGTNRPKDGFVPLDIPITPCNRALKAGTPACSCVDCEQSCPTIAATTPSETNRRERSV